MLIHPDGGTRTHHTTPNVSLSLCSGSLQPGSRRQSAVRVRLGEKEALDATLRYFEGRISRWGGWGSAWQGLLELWRSKSSIMMAQRCTNPGRCWHL